MRKTNKLVLFLVLAAFLFTAVASVSASTIAGDIGKDAVGTKYEKAVSKLAALGILKGYEDGTVQPDNMITRAEFAAIAIQELGLSDQIANMETQFSDVSASHWASGIVNLAAGKGIVKGFPDGTFRPDEQVTYAQAAAMLVQMLGWGPAVDGQPWPSAVLYRAADLDISKGVTMDASVAANRGDIFTMASNALESDLMDQSSWGDNNDWRITGETPLDKYFDVDVWKDDAIVIAAANVDDSYDADEINILYNDGDSEKSKQLTLLYGNPVDYLGMEVEAWVDEDDKEVLWISNETNASDIKYDFITEVNEDKNEVTLDIADDEYDINEDDLYIYVMNEKKSYSSLSRFESDFDKDAAYYGTIVLDNKGDVRFIAVAEFDYVNAGFVTEVDGDDVEYYEGEKDLTLDYTDYDDVFAFDSQMKAIDLDAVEEYSVIYAWENDDDDELFVVVANDTIEGELDRVSDDNVKIEGKSYDVSDRIDAVATVSDNDNEDIVFYLDGKDASDEAQNLVSEDVICFLDLAGDVRHMQGASNVSSGTLYGIMTDADRDAVTIFNEKGEEVTYDVEERADARPFYNYFTEKANSRDGNYIPVEYKLNKDGEIKEETLLYANIFDYVDINVDELDSSIEIDNFAVLEGKDGKIDLNKNDYIKQGNDYYYIEGSTVIMNYDFSDNDDPELVKWSDIEDTDTTEAKVAIVGKEGGKAKFVAFFENFDDVASDDWYYAVVTDGPDYNGDDYEVELNVLANDDIDSGWYVLDKDSDRSTVKEGTLIRFELSTSNKIKDSVDVVTVDTLANTDVVKDVDGKTLDLKDAGTVRIDGDAVVYTTEDDGDLDKERSYSNIKEGDTIVYLTNIDNNKLITAALILHKDYEQDGVEDVNKDDLEKAVADIDELNKDLYTAESWAALQDALADANAVLEDKDATEKEVADASKALEAAFKALALKDGVLVGNYEDGLFGAKVTFDMPEGQTEIDSATLNGNALNADNFEFGVDGTTGVVNVDSEDDEVIVTIGGVEYTLQF